MFVNAQILLVRCKTSKCLFGVRIQQRSGTNWDMTWAFPIDEKRAKNEGFDRTVLNVNCSAAEEFPGCPTCKATGFVKCGVCGKLTCYRGENSTICAWCNTKLDDIAYCESIDVSVGDD